MAFTSGVALPGMALGQIPTVTVLHSFDGSDGTSPVAALVEGPDGIFYGATARGGKDVRKEGTNGTLFSFSPNNALTTLHQFRGRNPNNPSRGDGSFPQGALIPGGDGTYYGTTSAGGVYGAGTVFVISAGGNLTLLHSFSLPSGGPNANSDGAIPYGGLTTDGGGNFYGATNEGGENGYGTVFRLTSTGDFAVLHSFTGTDGAAPQCPPILGGDGNLYGTASAGGNTNKGVVYMMTVEGDITVLHSFSGTGNDGASPYAALIEGSDQNFYGTTYSGGLDGKGTIFSITSGGMAATLYSFSGTSDGRNPQGVLFQDGEGNFFGTSDADSGGTVFELTNSGNLTTLHTFGSAGDGAQPVGGVIPGPGGNLYGTTTEGGVYGDGTIYRVNIVPLPVVTVAATAAAVTLGSGDEGIFTVSITAALSTDLIVTYTLAGSAVNGTDYAMLDGSKRIKAGDTSATIKVIPEGNLGGASKKTVKLTLSPGLNYTIGTAREVKVSIYQ